MPLTMRGWATALLGAASALAQQEPLAPVPIQEQGSTPSGSPQAGVGDADSMPVSRPQALAAAGCRDFNPSDYDQVPPDALPGRHTDSDAKWQPALDFDTDGCYNVAAIGPDGHIDRGRFKNEGTGIGAEANRFGCRDEIDLDNGNVYSRQRCNNGWCAYIYDYFFEKDMGDGCATGHTYDWEHIVVWVEGDTPRFVAASAHGSYDIEQWGNLEIHEGTHVKAVYHKDKAETHAFRFAKHDGGDEPPENHKGVWWRSSLLSWNGFPDGLRDKLSAYNFGSATMAIRDANFAKNLENSRPTIPIPGCCYLNPPCFLDSCAGPNYQFDFDVDKDDGSPGTPPGGGNPPTDPGDPDPPKTATKFMIVGDSITQGYQGDYTWRYRLWQWFKAKASNVNVDFVGPYTGTQTSSPPGPPKPPRLPDEPKPVDEVGNGPYALSVDAGFDKAHFAVWGRAAAVTKSQIYDQVRTYQPDMLLVALGFNDMGWFYSDDVGTLESMKAIVDNARAAKPDIQFAIANVPQRSFIGGRQDLVDKTTRYNAALRAAVPGWSKPTSRVEHVDFAGHYDCNPNSCPSGYDGLHPNAVGDYEIAQAFAEVLHGKYGIGSGNLDDPATYPIVDVSVPKNIKAQGVATGVAVTWDAVFGARGYDVRQRIQGNSEWETGSSGNTRYDTTLTIAGITWEYQIRTSAGDTAKGQWSDIVSAVSRRDTAPPPETITVTPSGTGFDMTWSAVGQGVDRYEVIIWDRDTTGSFIESRATRDTSITYRDLLAGHRYSVWVVCWNGLGGGVPKNGRPVRIGAGVPAIPTNVKVVNIDPTTVDVSWDSNGAGYQMYVRNINTETEYRKDQGVEENTSHGIAFLFPGTWNFEFCVGAVNGIFESGRSACVIPPKYPGF